MKIKQWWHLHKPTQRRLIQLYAALLFNAHLKGFKTGRIYQGPLKNFCTPGLNCYSCPGAAGACPLGALQNALADSGKTAPYYVIGILLLYGLLFGRWICGFLCPFGLIQDLLHKIRTPKLGKGRLTRILSYLKYVLLVFFVGIFPLIYAGYEFPLPAFCKYVCPAGTLEGAVGLLAHPENESMLGMLGPLFTWKFLLLMIFLVGAVFVYRFFCRFFCPLGAIYGLFNRISLVGVSLDRKACVDCGLCVGKCKMDIHHVGDHECIQCGECIGVCPTGAIQWKGPKILLPPQAIGGEIPTKSVNVEETTGSVDSIHGTAKPFKRTRAARIVAWALALALLGTVLCYFNFIHEDAPTATQGFEVGDVCAVMDLKLYGADALFNLRDQRDQVTVINFWGTWCGPCIAELPHFDELAEAYAGRVTVVAVHSTYKAETAADWILENYPDSRILFAQDAASTEAPNGAYYTALGGQGDFPMTLIVNTEGIITFTKRGSVTYGELTEAVEGALGGTMANAG